MGENIEGKKIPDDRDQKEARELGQLEITVESREEAVRLMSERFRGLLEERFGKEGKEPMDYHIPEHSETVANDTRSFLKIIRDVDDTLVSEEDIDAGYLEGWAHDLVQDSIKEHGKPRQRHRGFMMPQDIPEDLRVKGVTKGNERESANELLDELKRYRYRNGEPAFTIAPEKIAADIGVTYPKFDFSAQLPDGTMGLKVFQPYLTHDSSLRGLALATADLRGDARISKDLNKFRESGNAEFRELNFSIGEEAASGIEHIPQERKEEIAKAIIDWVKNQVGFVGWQKELFWDSINNNNTIQGSPRRDEIVSALQEEFGHFDDNIRVAKERYERVKDALVKDDEDFKNLLREVGYAVPSEETGGEGEVLEERKKESEGQREAELSEVRKALEVKGENPQGARDLDYVRGKLQELYEMADKKSPEELKGINLREYFDLLVDAKKAIDEGRITREDLSTLKEISRLRQAIHRPLSQKLGAGYLRGEDQTFLKVWSSAYETIMRKVQELERTPLEQPKSEAGFLSRVKSWLGKFRG